MFPKIGLIPYNSPKFMRAANQFVNRKMTKSVLKKLSLVLLMIFALGTTQLNAQKVPTYEYSFKVNGLQVGDTCMLAYYLGSKQYIKDTVVVSKPGLVTFKGSNLDGGIYLFVVPGMSYFEFIATEAKISMETELKSLVASMKVKTSAENTIFYEYLKAMEALQKESGTIKTDTEKQGISEADKKRLTDRLLAIDQEVIDYRNKAIQQHKGTFVAKLLRASMEPEVPKVPEGMSEEEGKNYQFRKYKSEYLDFVDFSDERMLRTPILERKIKDYLNRLTVQDPDSIIVSVEDIMKLSTQNSEVFKYCVITITNLYAAAKQMCFDKIYVHMAGNYYVSGKADWVDSTQFNKIKDRYYKMLYNTCGRTAVNLVMNDTKGQKVALSDIRSKYTIVVFWAHDCGHCKKEMPQLVEFYKKYKEHGVQVFAVSTKEETQKWKDFILDKGLEVEGWINAEDPQNKTNFRVFYDIYSTPVIYLLDADKKILAKRMDVPTLERLICHELGLPAPEQDKTEEEKHD